MGVWGSLGSTGTTHTVSPVRVRVTSGDLAGISLVTHTGTVGADRYLYIVVKITLDYRRVMKNDDMENGNGNYRWKLCCFHNVPENWDLGNKCFMKNNPMEK